LTNTNLIIPCLSFLMIAFSSSCNILSYILSFLVFFISKNKPGLSILLGRSCISDMLKIVKIFVSFNSFSKFLKPF
jgi:hypothetical protein